MKNAFLNFGLSKKKDKLGHLSFLAQNVKKLGKFGSICNIYIT